MNSVPPLTPQETEAVVDAPIEQFGPGELPRAIVASTPDGAWRIRWEHQDRAVAPMGMDAWQAWLRENVGSLDAGDLETMES